MSAPEIDRIGVLGCGVMGSGIAEVAARAGLDVAVVVSRPEAAGPALARIEKSLDQGVRRNRITEAERDAARARITVGADLDLLADRQFVVEAVREDEDLKTDLFALLDKTVEDETAILASNTSSIPISRLAAVTSRPQRVIGVHFFSPVPMMPLVEVVSGMRTAPGTRDRTARLLSGVLGKTVIDAPDRAGFLVNGLLVPYLLAAMRMVESGRVSAETVDQAMTLGCAHPVGPLRLADLIGLDVIKAVADALHDEFAEQLYAPPPVLRRLVEAGLLGKKTGHGFHTYG
ncbi:3-hydroxybutyryl-CoA dehydrogenase [Actinoplanes missouriensis]|uniref:3-hydroxybutyryl-CoA dehydrogenase n=1 Tax=Actinoplanes missouriensis TaxID=1866 RepID=UPI0033F72D03